MLKMRYKIYEGLLGTQWRLQIKTMNNNQFVLQGYKGFVIFDKATFDIVKEIIFPDHWSEVDISSDGKRMAFRTVEGIYKTVLGPDNPESKVESNDKDHTYRLPTWSLDGEALAFFEDIGQKNDNGNLKIVTVDDNVKKGFSIPAGLSVDWLPNNKHIIACAGGSLFGINASLFYIDTKTDQISTYEKEGQITVFKVSEDKVMYRHNPKNSQYSAQLILYDIKTSKEDTMTPSLAEITTAEYSGNGNIAFVGKFTPQEPLTIYLIRKEIEH